MVVITNEGFYFQSGEGENVSRPFDPQSLNRYSYVNNRPSGFVDPSGHNQDLHGGRVYNNSKRTILVHGSMLYSDYKTQYCQNLTEQQCRDNVSNSADGKKYSRILYKAKPNEDGAGLDFVQGWWELAAGKASYQDLHIVDVDYIMANEGDRLGYCPNSGCPGLVDTYGYNEAELKINNVDDAYITDTAAPSNVLIVTIKSGWPRHPIIGLGQSLAHRGWKGCDPRQGRNGCAGNAGYWENPN